MSEYYYYIHILIVWVINQIYARNNISCTIHSTYISIFQLICVIIIIINELLDMG